MAFMSALGSRRHYFYYRLEDSQSPLAKRASLAFENNKGLGRRDSQGLQGVPKTANAPLRWCADRSRAMSTSYSFSSSRPEREHRS